MEQEQETGRGDEDGEGLSEGGGKEDVWDEEEDQQDFTEEAQDPFNELSHLVAGEADLDRSLETSGLSKQDPDHSVANHDRF